MQQVHPPQMCALAACLANGAPSLVKALLHPVQIAVLEHGALFMQEKILSAICVGKGHTTATLACPMQLHVYCAVRASMAQVEVPTQAASAPSVPVAGGQRSEEHKAIMIAPAVPMAHGAPHLLRQLMKLADTVMLESGVLFLAAASQMFASRVIKASGVIPLAHIPLKLALTVLLASGATPQALHHRTHVETACVANGAQLLEQRQNMFAHTAMVA